VDETHRFQEIDGFGTALTDGAAWLFAKKLLHAQIDTAFRMLFARDGGYRAFAGYLVKAIEAIRQQEYRYLHPYHRISQKNWEPALRGFHCYWRRLRGFYCILKRVSYEIFSVQKDRQGEV
jgi:hypothetical protein